MERLRKILITILVMAMAVREVPLTRIVAQTDPATGEETSEVIEDPGTSEEIPEEIVVEEPAEEVPEEPAAAADEEVIHFEAAEGGHIEVNEPTAAEVPAETPAEAPAAEEPEPVEEQAKETVVDVPAASAEMVTAVADDGYSFDHWESEGETVSDSETLNAEELAPASYTALFQANGETAETETPSEQETETPSASETAEMPKDTAVAAETAGSEAPTETPAEETKEAADAPEEVTDPAEEPSEEEPVKAPEETAETYTVTFKAEGFDDIVITVNAGEAVGEQLPDAPEKEGYRFIRWVSGDTEITADTVPAENMEAAAEFVQLFTVSFTVDGETYASLTVEDGKTIGELPEAPVKEGYRFVRWVSGEDPVTAETTVAADMTVAAEFVTTSTVTFHNRDGEVVSTKTVDTGTAVGELPEPEAREDYTAHWAVGTYNPEGQGSWVAGDRVNETYVVTGNVDLIPVYDRVTYTITFYEEDKTTEVTSKMVDASTSYSLNDIPSVPSKEGSSGKWVYDGGDFTNEVRVSGDTAVWAEYDKTVLTVTYLVGEETYETDTYYKGDSLTLPSAPTATGKKFLGWYVGDTQYEGGETVNTDLTLTAKFEDKLSVVFYVDGSAVLSQYYESGETIDTMPQEPFVAGKVFEKWAERNTGEEVTAETEVTSNMTVDAVFREVSVYSITAEYYYLNDSGREVVFNTELLQVEAHELPYTITAPATTQTSSDEVSGAPIYYPETPTVEVAADDFDADHNATVRVEYVPFTAKYDFVYMLKDLTGDGYTEIDRTSDVEGVLNSYVTPTVKTFDYATLELAEGATITQAEGQELKVYYTRKNFSLSYQTNGGSYVAGGTYAYGATAELPTTNPTRSGYTFAGWYLDEELTQEVTGSVEITKNTTLYAKWEGDTVNYTIVYMFEKYNDAGTEASYVYDNSETGSGKVGNTVKATDSGIPDKTKTGWEKDAPSRYSWCYHLIV